MEHLIIPKNYQSQLNLHDTQIAIKTVKDFFQNLLSLRLNLSRVSAPLFVDPDSGLNDNLNGVERPVTFTIKEQNERKAEVVHSLAKWKRYALKHYDFKEGEGLYKELNFILFAHSVAILSLSFFDYTSANSLPQELQKQLF